MCDQNMYRVINKISFCKTDIYIMTEQKANVSIATLNIILITDLPFQFSYYIQCRFNFQFRYHYLVISHMPIKTIKNKK